MQPGTYRVYSDEFDSMWCCTGTGLECPGKYAQMIYTHAADNSALDVNLFIASELSWKEAGISLRQETRFPEEASTTLTVTADHPEPFAIRVRHPAWIPAGQMKLAVNGEAVDSTTKPGEFAQVRRSWKAGDKVRIDLPMRLSMERLPNSSNYAAVLYGPIVLSGVLGTEGLSRFDFWQINTTVPRKILPESRFPAIVAPRAEDLLTHLKAVPGKALNFRTEGGLMKPAEVEMIPFYQNHYQRYAIYWRTATPEAYAQQEQQQAAMLERERQLDARSIDRVKIGDTASETAHAFKGQRTNTGTGAYGQFSETHWRDANSGGFFSYDVKVAPDKPVVLSCTYWGQETGARTFDIFVNDKVLTTTALTDRGMADFYSVDTPIPAELTAGKSAITLRFQPRPNNTAGGIFDIRILPLQTAR